MKMHTPPICRGQIVIVSYGARPDGYVYRREFDQSDRSVQWARAPIGDCGCTDECDCFDPVNSEPTNYNWAPCDPPGGE